jgi:hypothetical protein
VADASGADSYSDGRFDVLLLDASVTITKLTTFRPELGYLEDMRVEVDLIRASTAWGDAGLVCRAVEGEQRHYYAFLIGSGGAWQIVRRETGSDSVLASGSSSAIKTEVGASNRLVAECTGIDASTLTFTVNGMPVGTATDAGSSTTTNFIYGHTGFRVHSLRDTPVEAQLDNFVVNGTCPTC